MSLLMNRSIVRGSVTVTDVATQMASSQKHSIGWAGVVHIFLQLIDRLMLIFHCCKKGCHYCDEVCNRNIFQFVHHFVDSTCKL